jgi:hypothetical protein
MAKQVKQRTFNLRICILGAMCWLLIITAPSAQSRFPTGAFSGADLHVTFTASGKMLVKDKGVLVIEAIYSVNGDQIIFTDKQGKYACIEAVNAVGKYRWKYDGKALRFTKVEDRCESRIKTLTMLRLSRQK